MNEIKEQPDKMGKAFLDLVSRGETRWKRYILTLLIIIATWTLGSGTVLLAVYGPEPEGSPMDGTSPFLDFIALNLLFVTVLIGLWIGICNAHKRSLFTLITPRDHIRWRRILQGFGLQMGLGIVFAAIDALLFPDNYTYTLDPERFYKFAILVSAPYAFSDHYRRACSRAVTSCKCSVTSRDIPLFSLFSMPCPLPCSI